MNFLWVFSHFFLLIRFFAVCFFSNPYEKDFIRPETEKGRQKKREGKKAAFFYINGALFCLTRFV